MKTINLTQGNVKNYPMKLFVLENGECQRPENRSFFGQFLEIQKCRSELMRTLNKLEKANGKEKKKAV